MAEATPTDSWLAPGECLVHIGVYKTGTTSIQEMLAARRDELSALGFVYPGDKVAHNTAAMAHLGLRRGWKDGGRVPDSAAWDRLVAGSLSPTARTLVSSEVFCQADDERAASVITAFGSHRTKVLVTVRPLEGLLPSSWQEFVKGGLQVPFDDWLNTVMRGPGASTGAEPTFWTRNDFGPLVERWTRLAGAENVTVVVIDPRRPSLLYDAFEHLTGLPPGFIAPDPHAVSNRSMSAAEAELVRALNERVRSQVQFTQHRSLVRDGAVRRLVAGRRPGPDESRLTLPSWAVEQARQLSVDVPDRIRATGAHVIGDLAALLPTGAIPADDDRSSPTSIPLDAALLLLEGMMLKATHDDPPRRAGRRPPPR
jgi:hypothetical protein